MQDEATEAIAVVNKTNMETQQSNTNSGVERMNKSKWSLSKYDPQNSDDSTDVGENWDNSYGNHTVVTHHGQWGTYLYCTRCEQRATESEMGRLDCITENE